MEGSCVRVYVLKCTCWNNPGVIYGNSGRKSSDFGLDVPSGGPGVGPYVLFKTQKPELWGGFMCLYKCEYVCVHRKPELRGRFMCRCMFEYACVHRKPDQCRWFTLCVCMSMNRCVGRALYYGEMEAKS